MLRKIALLFVLVPLVAFFGCATDDDSANSGSGDGHFTVSEEMYEQTFSEVDQVIEDLNQIIAQEDYEAWLRYLTPEYIDSIMEPENLAALNNSTLLQRNSITLETLRDYFTYVVVPSRTGLRLDDLVFIDDNTVQAIMIIRDQRAILYLLRRVDGRWRISV